MDASNNGFQGLLKRQCVAHDFARDFIIWDGNTKAGLGWAVIRPGGCGHKNSKGALGVEMVCNGQWRGYVKALVTNQGQLRDSCACGALPQKLKIES